MENVHAEMDLEVDEGEIFGLLEPEARCEAYSARGWCPAMLLTLLFSERRGFKPYIAPNERRAQKRNFFHQLTLRFQLAMMGIARRTTSVKMFRDPLTTIFKI